MTSEPETRVTPDGRPPDGAAVHPNSCHAHPPNRGVLPRKNDKVIKNPDAHGVFAFATLRPDLDRASALHLAGLGGWLRRRRPSRRGTRSARRDARA